MSSIFFFYCDAYPPDLHSFPTRRSSDLPSDSHSCFIAGPWTNSAPSSMGWLAKRRFRTVRTRPPGFLSARSEEHTSELQSHSDLVCRLLLEKKNKKPRSQHNRDKGLIRL